MIRAAKHLLLPIFAISLFGQAPVTIPVTIVSNLTSPTQVFDNRSIQRQCNNTTFAVSSGTGAWSVRLEYSDTANTGPWTSFGSGATVTSSSPLSVGVGYGYHLFMRLNTTVGTTVAQLSCETNFWLPTGGGGGGGGAGNPGGLPGDFQINVGGTSFGGVTPPIPINLGGTGTSNPFFICNNGVACSGAFPFYTITATSPTVYAGTPYQQVPTGTINGTNTTFTLAQVPNGSTLNLYRNGEYQKPTLDYTLATSTITFLSGAIPQTGDVLWADYQYGSSAVSGNATTINGATIPPNAIAGTNSSSQIVDATAFIRNVGNKAIARLLDWVDALDFGNGSTTGIAGAAAACGTTTPCSVLVPAGYPQTELVPGTSTIGWYDGSPPSAITIPNITYHDQRWGGDNTTILNCFGYNVPGNRMCELDQYDYILNSANLRTFEALGPKVLVTNAMAGGLNQGGDGLVDSNKTNWFGGGNTVNRWTNGQVEALGAKANCYGLGDCLIQSNQFYLWTGPNAATDEGGRLADNEGFQGSDEPTGIVGSFTGSSLVVSSWTYGQGHQGVGRYVIRENAGTLTGTVPFTCGGGGVSACISSPGGVPTTVTVSGSYTPSNVVGTIGTNIEPTLGVPISVTVTPTFTTGSISLITTSTQVCVADPDGGMEAVYPTAVSGSTFTATFRKVHSATAIMAAGGLSCTYGFSLNRENITNSAYNLTSNVKIQNISGTLHHVIPVIYNTASTVTLYYATNAQWDSWPALILSSQNGYTIYPMAEITSVVSGGAVGNTITLAPNNVTFAPGDTFGVPQYFSLTMLTGANLLEQYWPNSYFQSGGFSMQYNQVLTGSSFMAAFYNNTDPSLYANGVIGPPQGLDIFGYVSWGLQLQYSPEYWVIGVGCASPGLSCSNPETLFHLDNQDSSASPSTGGSDTALYDPLVANEYWQWTTQARSGATYSMFSDHLDINGGALTLEEATGKTQIGINLTGSFVIGLNMQQPAYWGLGVGCTSPCTTLYTVIAANNSVLHDNINYDPLNKQYSITANNFVNSAAYTFGATTYTTPWFANYAGVDSATSQNFTEAENFVLGNVVGGLPLPPCDSTHTGWISPAYYGTQASTIETCTNRNGNYQWINLNTGIETFTYTAAPAFNGYIPASQMQSLSGNITSWTLSAGPIGQTKTIIWCQDTSGGHTIAAAPSNVRGFVTPGTTANTCSSQEFIQILNPGNEWIAVNNGVQNVPY